MEYRGHWLVCRAILQRLEISLPGFAPLLLSVSTLNSYRRVAAKKRGSP